MILLNGLFQHLLHYFKQRFWQHTNKESIIARVWLLFWIIKYGKRLHPAPDCKHDHLFNYDKL